MTYVPAHQKERWKDDADELDMSQSEFVRTMVQAGRRSLDLGTAEAPSSSSDPGGNGLEDAVLDVLSREDFLSWQELLGAVTGDIEERLDDALERLQASDRVRYSGRHGGYCEVDDE